MNSAQDVSKLIEQLKVSSSTMSEAAWKAAIACVGWPYVFGGRGQYCTPANRRSRDYTAHPTIKTACKNFDGTGSCSGCKWYPGGLLTRFFDCRGFTYWILKQIYGWELIGAGCTSQWDRASNWKAKGEVKDGIPQGVIVCLFYYKKDSKGKRTSTLEHTGFYYNGQTVECSSGVQHSKTLNKKWEVWGIPACAEGSGEVINMPTPVVTEPSKKEESLPTLRKGSKGQYVILLQTKLLNKGYSLPRYGADGDYGTETLNAVKAFQKANGLTADGVVGEKTWKALNDATVAIPYYTVTVSHLTEEEKNKLMSEYGDRVINTVEG